MNPPMVISLPEYQPCRLEQTTLSKEMAQRLATDFASHIAVKSLWQTDQWELTNLGRVGYIPLTPELHIRLESKVPLSNLFGMVEYVFDLHSLQFLPGVMNCQTLEGFYERLALKLAELILQRMRQGLYRAYIPHTGRLAYLRGRLAVDQLSRQPGQVNLPCRYQEQTADIADNQILVWTLRQILRSGLCRRPAVQTTLQQAYRALQKTVRPLPYTPNDCVDRPYQRLNEDYRPLHHLCRFFLETTGPAQAAGNYLMLPFVINMATLYEQFVAAWLKQHLPPRFQLKTQERVDLDQTGHSYFRIDLVLYDLTVDRPVSVLDTKYKIEASQTDLHQVTAYATSKHCRQAVLIYPTLSPIIGPQQVGEVQVRRLPFSLTDDLEAAGQRFLAALNLPGCQD